MQRTEIIGRVGKDAEVKTLDNGMSVINFSVAVTETWKDKQGNKQEKANWYECAKWGEHTKVAEFIKKGSQVYVEGTSEARAFISGEEAKAVNCIKVHKIELLGGKGGLETPSDDLIF